MTKRKTVFADAVILLLFGPGIIMLCLHWLPAMYDMQILRYAGFIVGSGWTLFGIIFFLNAVFRRRRKLEYISLGKFMNNLKQTMERSCKHKDVTFFLKKYTHDGYSVDTVKPIICPFCGKDVFEAYYEDGNGTAVKCCSCKKTHHLLDSEHHWGGPPIMFSCPKCGALPVHLWVGLSYRESGDIRWVYIVFQCPACHSLDIMLEWEINYGPTAEIEKSLDRFHAPAPGGREE